MASGDMTLTELGEIGSNITLARKKVLRWRYAGTSHTQHDDVSTSETSINFYLHTAQQL
jgi:hypothetical protein